MLCKLKLLVAACAFLLLAPALPGITLVENGVARYDIVVAPGEITAEMTAAQELRDHLRQMTGCELNIVRNASTSSGRHIYVGQSPEISRLLPDIDFGKLGRDEIVIRTAGDALILSGGRPRGTLYAVYTFLEETLGVRWWTSMETEIPSRKTVSVGPLNVRYNPPFFQRETHFQDVIYNPLFAARLKNNGQHPTIPADLGGQERAAGFYCHSFWKLIPEDIYGKEHPEWFGLYRGKRTGSHVVSEGQLCLTNPALLKELTKNAKIWLDLYGGCNLIALSQNDNMQKCECPACTASDQKEGSPAGTLINFVNPAAAELEKYRPGVIVETFAYTYTFPPPRHARPRSNVMIRLCSINADFARPLSEDGEFGDAIRNWAAISQKLGIWNYIGNFRNYLLIHPNTLNIARDIKFFADNKAIAVFQQGSGDRPAYCNDANADLVQLKAYLSAHLLWNPQADPEAVIHDFTEGYYGPKAGPVIRKYLHFLDGISTRSRERIRCYMDNTDGWLPLSDAYEAYRMMREAEKAAGNVEPYAARVRRSARSAKLTLLLHDKFAVWEHSPEAERIRAEIDAPAMTRELIREYRDSGTYAFREVHGPFPLLENWLLARQMPASSIAPDFVDADASWFEIPAARFGAEKGAVLAGDSAAAGGKALFFPAGKKLWLQTILPLTAGEWKAYALLRCDGGDGKALSLGFHDYTARKPRGGKEVSAESIASPRYVPVEIGRVTPDSPNLQFFLYSDSNPSVRNLRFERLIMVKEKAR